jgi:hypothetical protein
MSSCRYDLRYVVLPRRFAKRSLIASSPTAPTRTEPSCLFVKEAPTTTDVYMQEIPASVQSTINSINSELRKSDARGRKASKESALTGAVVSSRRRSSGARDTK